MLLVSVLNTVNVSKSGFLLNTAPVYSGHRHDMPMQYVWIMQTLLTARIALHLKSYYFEEIVPS